VAVQKFRSVEDMEAAPVLTGVENSFERFLRHCARYRVVSPRVFPRGVFKFRTIEEAQAGRERVNLDSVASTHRAP
jgi:hypothetical protein